MGVFSTLSSLFKPNQTLEVQLANPFLHLNTGKLASQLKLVDRGMENGSSELPASNSIQFDQVENEIEDNVMSVWRQAQQEATAQFQAYDERISGLGLLAQVPAIDVSATQAVSEMQAAVAQANLRLTSARDTVRQSYAQLHAFQKQHSLNRPAQLDRPFIATTGAIVLTWVAETVANSLLLRQNDDMGLLGGVIAAATIGIINIGVACFVGRYVWSNLQQRSSTLRGVFIGITILWGIFTLIWNLLAAHYRDAKVAGLENPEIAALSLFSGAPDSIYSWGLFFLGIIFAIVADNAAYRMDDPYPGYGAVYKEHQQRCADYAGEIEDAADKLSEIHDDAIGEAADVRRELALQLGGRDRALNGRNAFMQRYLQFHEEMERACNQLLTIYRDANRKARTSDAPKHFDEHFGLPPLSIPPAPELKVTQREVEHADNVLKEAVGKISHVYLEGVTQFETLEALKARLPNA